MSVAFVGRIVSYRVVSALILPKVPGNCTACRYDFSCSFQGSYFRFLIRSVAVIICLSAFFVPLSF